VIAGKHMATRTRPAVKIQPESISQGFYLKTRARESVRVLYF